MSILAYVIGCKCHCRVLSVAGISTHAATAQIDLVHAAYKGAAPLVQDLIGGQVQAAWLDAATLAPLKQAGKIKVLAMTGTQRTSSLSQVPTFVELGLKGFEPVGFFLVLAPVGMNKEVLAKLSGGIARAIQSPELTARWREWGLEAVGSTGECAVRCAWTCDALAIHVAARVGVV